MLDGESTPRRVNLHAINATLDADPAPSRTCRIVATRARRASASRLGIGAAWQKQFWDFFFSAYMHLGRAVAAGARLARVVRGQIRRDRAATSRA